MTINQTTMTIHRDVWSVKDKKIPYALKLRPSTISLMTEAAKAANVSKNLVVERGTVAESKKILKKVKKGIDFDSE